MLAELLHVDFETDEEHQQQLAQFGEEVGDLGIAWQHAQQVRPDQDADQDVADHGGDAQATGGVRSRQDQEHDDGETRHGRQVNGGGVDVHCAERD